MLTNFSLIKMDIICGFTIGNSGKEVNLALKYYPKRLHSKRRLEVRTGQIFRSRPAKIAVSVRSGPK